MPFLLVNLDDVGDMQRSMRQLRRRLQRQGQQGQEGRKHGCGPLMAQDAGSANKTPLKQKLMRVKQRGVWRFLVGIARLDQTPRSLQEIDEALGLQRNKMRSTKAIFAKLENRLDLRFLKVAEDAEVDEAGNPRYIMPPRIRGKILEVADE
jgi:hypothetical protein